MTRSQRTTESFAVAPLRKHSRVVLVVIMALLPMGLAVTWLVEPAAAGEPVVTALMLAVAVGVIAVLAYFTRRCAIELGPEGLTIRATFYTGRFDAAELDLAGARVADLREHRELRPTLKTNGYALPGFAAGHFRDRRRRKLFCLVTAPRVVVLPLHDGRRVLLSPERPEELLRRLRAAAAPEHDRH